METSGKCSLPSTNVGVNNRKGDMEIDDISEFFFPQACNNYMVFFCFALSMKKSLV